MIRKGLVLLIALNAPKILAALTPDLANWRQLVEDGGGEVRNQFISYGQAEGILAKLTETYPSYIRSFKAGQTVEGRTLNAYWISLSRFQNEQLDSEYERVVEAIQASIDIEESSNYPQGSPPAAVSPTPTRERMYPKGRILLTGMHHAREPASATVLLYFVFESLERVLASLGEETPIPSEDANQLALMMADRDIVFVPMLNPDGYEAIKRTKDYSIRKNRRQTCSAARFKLGLHRGGTSGPWIRWIQEDNDDGSVGRGDSASVSPSNFLEATDGVDLNRNYAYKFESVHNKCDRQEYEGPFAFSEPETRTVRRLIKILRPQVAVNFHSYGDVWTHPLNCCLNTPLPAYYQTIYDEIQAAVKVPVFGSAPTIDLLGYTTSGEADDWMYAEEGVVAMSPEVGPSSQGFWPSVAAVQTLHRENFPRVANVAIKSGQEYTAGIVRNSSGPSGLKLTIVNSGLGTSSNYSILLLSMQLFGNVSAPMETEEGESTLRNLYINSPERQQPYLGEFYPSTPRSNRILQPQEDGQETVYEWTANLETTLPPEDVELGGDEENETIMQFKEDDSTPPIEQDTRILDEPLSRGVVGIVTGSISRRTRREISLNLSGRNGSHLVFSSAQICLANPSDASIGNGRVSFCECALVSLNSKTLTPLNRVFNSRTDSFCAVLSETRNREEKRRQHPSQLNNQSTR